MPTKKIGGSYTKYYLTTRSPKLREPIDIKKIIMEEVAERYGVH